MEKKEKQILAILNLAQQQIFKRYLEFIAELHKT